MPHVTVALTAQYLNVRQRKLGTIIIQTVRILQHESAVKESAWNIMYVHVLHCIVRKAEVGFFK
jgi:hypothetical protein